MNMIVNKCNMITNRRIVFMIIYDENVVS